MFEFLIVRDVEKISNELYYLYHYLSSHKPKVDKVSLDYLQFAFRSFEQLLDHYFRKDTAYLEQFMKEKDTFLFEELDKLLHHKKINMNIIHHSANIIRRCQDMVGPFYGRYL